MVLSNNYLIYVYDNTFEGLLTCVFESYSNKQFDISIVSEAKYSPQLFAASVTITTNLDHAARVWKAISKKTNTGIQNNLLKCFLSELSRREEIIYQYITYIFNNEKKITQNFGNKYVLELAQICKKVGREKHRMEAFVRFQKLADNSYYAVIEPDYDVLPLIAKHFKDRYSDQKWVIYDVQRNYGIAYDLQSVTYVYYEFNEAVLTPTNVSEFYDDEETHYQHLWKSFFTNVNIKERKNEKLHVKSLPYRYWKYLTEKQEIM